MLTRGLAAFGDAGERIREGVVVAVEERGGAVAIACGERKGKWLWRREKELQRR